VDWTGSIELIVAFVGLLSAVLAGLWAVYRQSQRVVRYWRTLSDFHDYYGMDPVKTLARIVSQIETGQGELELRQRIAERHLKIGVYVCDIHGECTWANDVLCATFGLDSREVLGNGWLAAVAEDDQERVFEHWKRCVLDKLPYQEQYRVVPPDGTPWYAYTQSWPVITDDNRLLCYVGYITERTHVQEDPGPISI